MLVKINDRYKGVYGHFNKDLNTVTPKRAGDPPFDVPAPIAERQIENGVLVAVNTNIPAVKKNVVQSTPAPVLKESAPKQPVKDYSKMSWNELKKEAKEKGISYAGKKKNALIELLKESDEQAEPVLSAEDPV